MLSDADIEEAARIGDIDIEPYDENNLGPDSYDVHLDSDILIPQLTDMGEPIQIDPSQNNESAYTTTKLPHYEDRRWFYLAPGEALLGATVERLSLNARNIAADIAGCSGIGRYFIMVHVTAGFIDSGWGRPDGAPLTVELVNVGPFAIRLWAGMRIAQIRFYRTESEVIELYNERDTSEYLNATGPQGSHYHQAYRNKRNTHER